MHHGASSWRACVRLDSLTCLLLDCTWWRALVDCAVLQLQANGMLTAVAARALALGRTIKMRPNGDALACAPFALLVCLLAAGSARQRQVHIQCTPCNGPACRAKNPACLPQRLAWLRHAMHPPNTSRLRRKKGKEAARQRDAQQVSLSLDAGLPLSYFCRASSPIA
jgi:hypothetical protein